MAPERRVDPEDGNAYTLDELRSFYRGKFKPKDIAQYWDSTCRKVRGQAEGKAKAKAAATKAPGTGGAAAKLAKVMAARERDWRIGPIVYQVFVDRFAPPADIEGRRALFPAPCTLHKWDEPPKRGEHNKEVGYWGHELQFWGGDLQSLRSKLEYVKGLGAGILYLQPICEAYSNHKYDATDYCKVDPQYGTLEDFEALVKDLRSKEMKLVLDGVFNHMGRRNAHVQEALDDAKSKTRDWFFIGDEHEKGFKTWGCSDNLAELKLETRSLQEHLWGGRDSVVATWLKRGADGWRLDVAQELGFEYLERLTAAAHRHKRGSLVVGEVWAYPSRWTAVMDGVLNLHLGVLIFGVVEGKYPGPTAAQSVANLVADCGHEAVLRSWTVLSNHDTPRLAHRLPELAPRLLALTLQFVLPGCPLVYYGDEIGLDGGDDPENRGTFRWESATDDNAVLAHTRKLVSLRQRLRALRIGDFRALVSQKLLAFMRATERVMDTVIVLANPTSEPVMEMVTVPDDRILGYTLFRDEVGGEEVRILGATVAIEVKPGTVRVLSMVNEDNPSGAQYKRIYGHWASFKGLRH